MVARQSRSDPTDAMDEESLRIALAEGALEIERLEDRVSDLQNSGARFLTGAAHAIRNNLTVIQSYLEIIHSDLTAGLSDQLRPKRSARHRCRPANTVSKRIASRR